LAGVVGEHIYHLYYSFYSKSKQKSTRGDC